MSLITGMLRDLDARLQGSAQPASPTPHYPRAPHPAASYPQVPYPQVPYPASLLPPPGSRVSWHPAAFVLQVVLTVAVAAGAGWWASQWSRPAVAPAPAAAATTPLPAAPVVAQAPALAPPVQTPVARDAVVADAPAPRRTSPPGALRAPRAATAAVAASTPAPRRSAATPPLAELAASRASAPATATDDAAARAERSYEKALSAQGQGQAEQAIKSLQEALALAPRHVKARLTLARLLNEHKQAPAAASLLADGLMLLPRQADFILALAPLWIQAGQENDAMALLAQGVRHADNSPAFHGYYASQLLRLKRHSDAALNYRIALKGEPGQHEWWLGLGLALQATGRTAEAVDAFTQALNTGKLGAQQKSMVEQLLAKMKAPVS